MGAEVGGGKGEEENEQTNPTDEQQQNAFNQN